MINISQSWLNRKLRLIMRVTFLLLLTTFMLSGVLIADKVNSQSVSKLDFTSIGEFSVSVGFQNSTLGEVLDLIEQQTLITFSYATALRVLPVSNLNYKNAELAKILEQIQNELQVDFIQVDGMIAVTPIKQTLKALPVVFASVDGTIAEQQTRNMIDGSNLRVRDIPQTNQVGTIRGRVVDARNDDALAGASVFIQSLNRGAVANVEGEFEIASVPVGNHTMTVSFIGYRRQEVEIRVTTSQTTEIEVRMQPASTSLQEVEVVSTGYQQIPIERAAGSFVHVGREILESRVSTNIINRLEDNIPGLIFQRDLELTPVNADRNTISIRGTSTIRSENQPLIVLDGFPYDGDLKNINPNDVENITILKDASAASIWGARAGNGVIVITTKSGGFNRPTNISFNSNTTIGQKPDAFHYDQMSVSDYVDAIEILFNHGHFQYPTSTANTVIPPLMQTLLDRRDGVISESEAQQQLNYYKQQDIRNDYDKYFYRNASNKQVSLNISGGTNNQHYTFSAGLDDNITNIVGNSYRRYTIDFKNTWRFLDERLNVSGGLNFVRTIDEIGNERGTTVVGVTYVEDRGIFPYTRLADNDGNPFPIFLYNKDMLDDAMRNGLMDWYYYPIQEVGLSPNLTDALDYRINTSIGYTILPGLRVESIYQYWSNLRDNKKLHSPDSYMVRDLVNSFTQVNADGSFSYPIPNGGILDFQNSNTYAHNFRTQVQFNRRILSNHIVTGLAGYEIRDQQMQSNSGRYYGYDDDLGLSQYVDHVTSFRSYLTGTTNLRISPNVSHTGRINRFISQYGNASYTYLDRYTLTVSFRRDASNIFGVETNNRVKPLWSAGISWTLSDEDFYNFSLLPYLKLRGSYGYNGNVNNSISALLTASYQSASLNQAGFPVPYVGITNPPNPNLRWEKVRMFNSGIDFATVNNRVSGNLEWFLKYGIDLIGGEIFPSSSGVSSFQGNFASTKTQGIDLVLRIRNVEREVRWNTDLNLSFVNEKVTHFGQQASIGGVRNYGNGRTVPSTTPVIGRPMHGIFSFHWAGLDPTNGDPMGYLNGEPSSDWASIMNQYQTPNDLIYHGPGRPPLFGAVRNTVTWNNLLLSVNISYRFGYYFRHLGVNYTSLTSTSGNRGTTNDYAHRWQVPGDETRTQIPSFRPEMPSAILSQRQSFYGFSEALIERGDHIRLQDIMLSYTLNNQPWLPLNRAQVYMNANNLGILWKKTNKVKDPDFRNYVQAIRTISVGIRIDY